MNTFPLQLCFKGARDYLHGTDMYGAIVQAIQAGNPGTAGRGFRMAIHGFARRQCRMVLGDPGEALPRPVHAVADFLFRGEGGDVMGELLETEGAVECRYPYDEEEIVGQCVVSGRTITIKGKSRHSAIEVLVAMTKHLHQAVHPGAAGKWVFTKLDLQRLLHPDDAAKFRLDLRQDSNLRLTKTEIFSGGETLGSIYFSLIPA